MPRVLSHLRLVVSSLTLALFLYFLISLNDWPIATRGDFLTLAQINRDRSSEAEKLLEMGMQQFSKSQLEAALETFQKELAIRLEINDQQSIWNSYYWIGQVYEGLGNNDRALNQYQQSLDASQVAQNPAASGLALISMGSIYERLGELPKALNSQQKALAFFRELGDRQLESLTLINLGNIYDSQGKISKALELYQQALIIAQQGSDQQTVGLVLSLISITYERLGNLAKALEAYQQALSIAVQNNDRPSEGSIRNDISRVFNALGDFTEALKFSKTSLVIFREIKDLDGEATTLNQIGNIYDELGAYPKALESYQQALLIFRKTGNRSGEATTLNNIGNVYYSLDKFQIALNFHQQALAINKERNDKSGASTTLIFIASTYDGLGDFAKAVASFEEALAINKEIGDRSSEGLALSSLGISYDARGEYPQALEYYQEALAIFREIGDREGESTTLNNIGNLYNALGEYSKALDFFQQALMILREVGSRRGEGITLNNIGNVYFSLNQYSKALDFYQQSLVISRASGDRPGEALTLHNIGFTWEQQAQPKLAVLFYKQAVNKYEAIRQTIRKLEQNLQQTYTRKVSDTYRQLVNLLLEQGRILESQKVLELLKYQEVRGYTHSIRAVVTDTGIQYTAIEQQILHQFDSLIAFGQKVSQCIAENCLQKSQLNQQREQLTAEFNLNIRKIAAEIRKSRATDPAFYNPQLLGQGARKIVEAQPKTMLIYPLVLKEKLWLLWVAPGGIANRIEVPVSQKLLGETAVKFRQLLNTSSSDITELQKTGQQLYQWLIQPLKSELTKLDENGHPQIQNLVFSLDRVTRYLPMAVLFDGQHYLIENYQIHTILSAELTDVATPRPTLPEQLPVLAFGLSQATPDFPALANVPQELDQIVQEARLQDKVGIFPGQLHLNQNFNFRTLADNLSQHGILHIATHGKFEPSLPEDSYLVMGNGKRLNIPDINTLQDLNQIHLAVLSACETALGGPDAEGLEISGLSYYFTVNDGAKAVMASLWLVNDSSTSQLMQLFYQNLASGTMTKAEALRQAQLAMFAEKRPVDSDLSRSSLDRPLEQGQGAKKRISDRTHPYYWAPFILIGNGL